MVTGAGLKPAAATAKDALPREAMQQYGVVPWRKDRHGNTQILLITSRTRGRWIVPKGWPVADRPPSLSAALEAFEEAGVIGEVLSDPLGSFHSVKRHEDGAAERRRVTLFSLRVVGTLTNWPEREQRRRRWFGLEEAAGAVDEPELAAIIRAIHDAPRMLVARRDRPADAVRPLELAAP